MFTLYDTRFISLKMTHLKKKNGPLLTRISPMLLRTSDVCPPSGMMGGHLLLLFVRTWSFSQIRTHLPMSLTRLLQTFSPVPFEFGLFVKHSNFFFFFAKIIQYFLSIPSEADSPPSCTSHPAEARISSFPLLFPWVQLFTSLTEHESLGHHVHERRPSAQGFQ